VTRDGKPIPRVVGEPRTVDKRPGKGRHTYAVTAIGPGGARSRPSDALVVRVGGTSPAWLALLLVPLLVVLGWYAVSRDGGGTARPATPSAPTADVVGLTVKLSWERPSSSTPQVREWRVLRDEQFVNTAPRPPYSDTVDKPGTYSYSLVAVGTDGQLSDPSAARTVTVSTEPTKVRADLRVSATQDEAGPDLVRVRVFNDGPDRADQVSVTVRASVPGAVKNVTMGQGVPCSPQAGVRVCGVDWINPHKPLAIVVHLDRSHAPFTVTASAQSRVVDPKSSNNRDTVLISGESKTSTTTTTSPNGMTQTTGTTTTAGPG
jgi:hypothetical protein